MECPGGQGHRAKRVKSGQELLRRVWVWLPVARKIMSESFVATANKGKRRAMWVIDGEDVSESGCGGCRMRVEDV